MKKIVIFLFLLSLIPLANANHSPQIVQRLSQSIIQFKHEQLSLLKELVNINSGTNNVQGVHQVGLILQQQLKQLGFKTFWVNEPAFMHRSPTLIAQHLGHKGKRLLLIGHLDTVFPANSPFRQFNLEQNLATGPGVIDDKGGDVVIIYALKALKQSEVLAPANITVVLTGDEENSGKPTSLSRKALFDSARQSDIALDFEWSINPHSATVSRRGIANWILNTTAPEAHSAKIFQQNIGDGAIFELSRILYSMRTQLGHEKYLSFNPGIILGGTVIDFDKNKSIGSAFGKPNVVAQHAMVQGDLRYLTLSQKFTAENKFKSIVSHHSPETSANIIFTDGIPAMAPSAENYQLLSLYSRVSVDLGYGPVEALDPGLRGAGDISHISAQMSGSLAGLGPVGTGAHTEKETLDVNSLIMQTQRAALLMYKLIVK